MDLENGKILLKKPRPSLICALKNMIIIACFHQLLHWAILLAYRNQAPVLRVCPFSCMAIVLDPISGTNRNLLACEHLPSRVRNRDREAVPKACWMFLCQFLRHCPVHHIPGNLGDFGETWLILTGNGQPSWQEEDAVLAAVVQNFSYAAKFKQPFRTELPNW